MHKTSRPNQIRLHVQLGTILIALVALTAAAVGLPTIWLVRQQLDQQAWRRVDQGSRTVEANLAAGLSDLSNLALLTAQRPTLQSLLADSNREDLDTYLQTLQTGAGIDLAVVCKAGQPLAGSAGQADSPGQAKSLSYEVCVTPTAGRFVRLEDAEPEAWMLAVQAVPNVPDDLLVVVGQALDEEFMQRLSVQSGLDVILLVDGQYEAGSLANGKAAWDTLQPALVESPDGTTARGEFTDNGKPYAAQRRQFENSSVEIVAALPTDEMADAQRRLAQTIGIGILVVVIAASGVAFYLARRISQPLERLRAAAVKLRKGDLTTPVGTRNKVHEIAQVAYALEDARSVLQHTLEALRREKEWGDHLLGSVVEGIVTLDRNGRITFFSQGAERITGWREEAALGKPADVVFRLATSGGDRGLAGSIAVENSAAAGSFLRSLPEPGGKPGLVVVQGKGRPVMLSITQANLAPPEAGRAGAALVLRDVSDEEAIRRLLGDFLANITHEFRTPLSALAASIELMLDQLPTLSQAELRELLDSLRLGTLSLQTLIDNLLEGASIEAGKFRVHPRPADLGEVVRETARTMQPLIEKYCQKLEVDLPAGDLPPARIDPRRTAQVLVNLLSNAIKWSPEGATLRLSVEMQGDEARVTVADSGPGIPAEYLPDVFTRFVHLEKPEGRAEYGAGLGLSVVKAIVEAQGGRVGVENRPEGGAAFWFTAAAAEPIATPDAASEAPEPPAGEAETPA